MGVFSFLSSIQKSPIALAALWPQSDSYCSPFLGSPFLSSFLSSFLSYFRPRFLVLLLLVVLAIVSRRINTSIYDSLHIFPDEAPREEKREKGGTGQSPANAANQNLAPALPCSPFPPSSPSIVCFHCSPITPAGPCVRLDPHTSARKSVRLANTLTIYSLFFDSTGLKTGLSKGASAFPRMRAPMVWKRSLTSSTGLLPCTFL